MAGIYIHIPFCKSKCTYCDFFSKTDLSQLEHLTQAMVMEIGQRKEYLKEAVDSIYFGGGTPSVLPIAALETIFTRLRETFTVRPDAEITLEANPDDLSPRYLDDLRAVGINRLSIGIQSFDNLELKAIRRRHSGSDALQAVAWAQAARFDNISIDLIFGLPGQSVASWAKQLATALSLDVQHLSCYGLMYEEGTPLWRQMWQGRVTPTDDDTATAMYRLLVETCAAKGYEQYEISNFARPGFRSLHNSAYWKQIPYLGIGPAAHSYDGDSRQWNIASVTQYIRRVNAGGELYFERELLSPQDKYNDFVMTALRTIEGIDLKRLELLFGKSGVEYCVNAARPFIEHGKLRIDGRFLHLTPDGVMISDMIIVDLLQTDGATS